MPPPAANSASHSRSPVLPWRASAPAGAGTGTCTTVAGVDWCAFALSAALNCTSFTADMRSRSAVADAASGRIKVTAYWCVPLPPVDDCSPRRLPEGPPAPACTSSTCTSSTCTHSTGTWYSAASSSRICSIPPS
eukprot:scaffold15188_cov85-Isochrysis_galbana.AAC.3